MVKAFFSLVRWPNLLITGLTVFALKYFVFKTAVLQYFSASSPQLNGLHVLLLAISIMLIAAAGYIINDVNDIKEDAINKPEKQIVGKNISVKSAKLLFYLLNAVGIILAGWIGKQLGNYQLAIPHVVASALLWVYSVYLSKSTLVGNLVVAVVSALVPLTYFLFESYPYIIEYKLVLLEVYKTTLGGPVRVLLNFCLGLSIFAFLLSLVREIIKDIQDEKGDARNAGKTLPIVLGANTAKNIAISINTGTILLVLFGIHYIFNFPPFSDALLLSYVYLLVVAPLTYLIFVLKKATTKSDFQKSSNIVKFVMLSGILCTYFYSSLI
jgi:4-hydroxybenzoate polyprenyltransferase